MLKNLICLLALCLALTTSAFAERQLYAPPKVATKPTTATNESFFTTVRIEAPAGTEKDYPRVMFLMENEKCWKYRWVSDRANAGWQLSGLADFCGSCGRQYSDDTVVQGQCVQNQTGKGFLPE